MFSIGMHDDRCGRKIRLIQLFKLQVHLTMVYLFPYSKLATGAMDLSRSITKVKGTSSCDNHIGQRRVDYAELSVT